MPDTEVIEETDDRTWLKRELIGTFIGLATYATIKVALDLTDEHSKLRWWLTRYWHEAVRHISSDEENRQIALASARGIAYAQVWLARQWVQRKDSTNGNP